MKGSDINEGILNLFEADGLIQGFFFSISKKGSLDDIWRFEEEFRNHRLFHDEVYIDAKHKYGCEGLMVIFQDEINRKDIKEMKNEFIYI